MRVKLIWVLVLLSGCALRSSAVKPVDAAPPLILGVDTHLHVSMSDSAKPIFKGEPNSGVLSGTPGTRLLNQLDSEGLRTSGVRLAFAAVWPPFDVRPGRSSLDETLLQLNRLRAFTRRQPDFAWTPTVKGARIALAQGRFAMWPAVEGGEGISSVDDVDLLYASGARALTVVHFSSNALGGAAQGQMKKNLLGIKPEGNNPEGLSPLGREVVERMMSLGIVIDVAHASDALVRDVLDMTEPKGVPIVYSHGGARALTEGERNLSDELAARIAKAGGLVGVTIYDGMIAGVPKSEQWDGYVPGTCDDVIAHWLHLAKVAGPEALVLGSDINGFITRPAAGGSCPLGIRHIGDLATLWGALEKHGVPRAALDGMGEKLLGLLEKVEAASDPSAQLRSHTRLKPALKFTAE